MFGEIVLLNIGNESKNMPEYISVLTDSIKNDIHSWVKYLAVNHKSFWSGDY